MNGEYLEFPWSMEDTVENMKEIRDILRDKVMKTNLHGLGEKDDKEVCFDFDRAIEALKKQIPKKVIQTQGDCCWVAKDGTEDHYIIYSCPSCGSTELIHGYPCKCNQALDWN